MKDDRDRHVYHGSSNAFAVAEPRKNIRVQDERVIFDAVSFHATPHRWIALAYTYKKRQEYNLVGEQIFLTMGVSLYDHVKRIAIYGFESLEKSLKILYGDGGFIYTFDAGDFIHTEGLGNLEVVVQKSVLPISAERIEDPVRELREAGVTFDFIDLSDSKNRDE